MSPHQVFTVVPMDCPEMAYEQMSIVSCDAPIIHPLVPNIGFCHPHRVPLAFISPPFAGKDNR